MATETADVQKLTRKDFVSDQEVRWCPGCGDYAILAQIQKVMPDLGVPKENIVFISGIGCSSRFPYYMDTYGIHSIHGRAPTLATGLALANPDLSVWVITGDGDGLSIGGNHLLHACRRNVNLNIVLFNNRIYGLTKGQYSPTSRQGHRTKSSPMGSIEQPINPLSLALSAEATFVARSMDSNVRHLADILVQAAAHKGTSFVEVYQNCVIFNPSEWDELSDRKARDDNMVFLEDGKPLVFGRERDGGIMLKNGFEPAAVQLGNGVSEEDLLVHDERSNQIPYLLSRLEHPSPMGVFRRVERPTYGDILARQVRDAQEKKGIGDLNTLYRDTDLWEVTTSDDVESRITGDVPLELDEEYVDNMDRPVEETDKIQDQLESVLIGELDPNIPITVEEKTSVHNAIRLMNDHNIGSVLVTSKEGVLVGIFTEQDVLKKLACEDLDLRKEPVEAFMTPEPFALKVDMPIRNAFHLMSAQGFRHLPLVDDDYRPQGIISFRDVVNYLRQHFI